MNTSPSSPAAGSSHAIGSEAAEAQERVTSHFDSAASYWRDVYESASLDGLIYRQRAALVIDWIDALGLGEGTHVVELGCGAGGLTVELARRGYTVDALDASAAMVELTAGRAERDGVARNVTASVADVQSLPHAAGTFDLAIAVGVIPWVPDAARAVGEMARVLAPGGHLILTADSRARLNGFVDPRLSPFLYRLRQVRWALTRRGRPRSTEYRRHWPSRIDRLLLASGLEVAQRATVGFGPFSMLGRPLLGEDAGVKLHRRLQTLSDRRVPLVRSTGWHYVVCARKPAGVSV